MYGLMFWTWPLRFTAAALMLVEYLRPTARHEEGQEGQASHEAKLRAARDHVHNQARIVRVARTAWRHAGEEQDQVEVFIRFATAQFELEQAQARLRQLNQTSTGVRDQHEGV